MFRVDPSTDPLELELVAAVPGANLAGIAKRASEYGPIVGVLPFGERSTYYWAEPYASLQSQLEALLPGHYLNLYEIDSVTGNYLFTAGPTGYDGTTYLGNLKTGSIRPLFKDHDFLGEGQLANFSQHSLAVPGGQIQFEMLVHPDRVDEALPTLFIIDNRSTLENYYGFDTPAHFFAMSGYRVVKVEIHNSSGREIDWLGQFDVDLPVLDDVLGSGILSWGEATLQDALAIRAHLVESDLIKDGEACVMGPSIGGSLALNLVARYPDEFLCGIGYKPIVDLGNMINRIQLAHPYSRELFRRYIGSNPVELRDYSPEGLQEEYVRPVMIVDVPGWEFFSEEETDKFVKWMEQHDREIVRFQTDGQLSYSDNLAASLDAMRSFLDSHLNQ